MGFIHRFVDVLFYLKASGKYRSISDLSAILMHLEFILLSCKNLSNFLKSSGKELNQTIFTKICQ